MKQFSFLLIIIISLNSCKVRTSNQTINNKREGRWVEQYTIDSAHYKSIGTYKNDDFVKKWCYFLNGKLIKKERYHKKYCKTKLFYENRKKQASGKTHLDQGTKELHWYYSGKWKFYDNNGTLTTVRIYNKGELVSEILSCKDAKLQSN
ncbi:hypothetical protein HNQ02_001979 [Flavobacterium sp. 7E]|uniref:hypothetical protein n=1 Tax=Flavobacterium sp. 7E TaxID=2735898 RepID=UPI00156E0068|nr:hypothetical protein [Flavobacterium sp. 7E]NRS89059.1 hypothetical protein [Flavobacterium sp. 7E]